MSVFQGRFVVPCSGPDSFQPNRHRRDSCARRPLRLSDNLSVDVPVRPFPVSCPILENRGPCSAPGFYGARDSTRAHRFRSARRSARLHGPYDGPMWKDRVFESEHIEREWRVSGERRKCLYVEFQLTTFNLRTFDRESILKWKWNFHDEMIHELLRYLMKPHVIDVIIK